MRPYHYCFIFSLLFLITPAFSQTPNFDETWKEFLDNNKISNMSELPRPNKKSDLLDYAKYLLMNTNSKFCQSEMTKAEDLMAEINEIDPRAHKAIPGFIVKKKELEAKIDAYHSMDGIWNRFLETREALTEELEDVKAAKSSCEKRTLAKYSYMTAHNYLCQGDVLNAKSIFETRTLRLAEKTSLRVRDVEGLEAEVRNMKTMFKAMSKLDIAWETFVETGESPGFDIDLPLFPCYPIPNMKALLLKSAIDICNAGPEALEKIKQLQADSGVDLDRDLEQKIKDLEADIEVKESNLAALNEAWEAFIPDNKVKHWGKYGYDYCSKEPLIKAYIMDGFAFVCETAEEAFEKIDALQERRPVRLDEMTVSKINDLSALADEYAFNGVEIESRWDQFVAQGDRLSGTFESTDMYCDNIQKVKDWTMSGLSSDCQEGLAYLEKIEDFNEKFDFNFYEELECRVQKLRIKVWDCRHQALQDIAKVEDSAEAREEKLTALMEEFGMEERPEVCSSNK